MDIIKLCTVLVLCFSCNEGAPSANVKRLTSQLLESDDQIGVKGRPVWDTSDTLEVKFGLSLISVLEINNMDNTGRFSVRQTYSWTDAFLRWNPPDFGGVDQLRIPVSKIWRPDIALLNSVGPETFNIEDTMAVVSSDGGVLWVLPVTAKVICQSDGNFPFERQICTFKYGSWTYDDLKLSINLIDEKDVNLDDYVSANDLALIESSAAKNVLYYPCCEEPYANLGFSVEFQAMSGHAAFRITLPTAIMFLMILLIFWLHPGSVSKFVIGGIVFLGLLILMLNLASVYRATKLLLWLGLGMVLTFTAMLTSVITGAVAKKGNTGQALPHCLNMVCVKVFGLILCSDRPSQNNMRQSADEKSDDETDKEMVKQQWVAFAQVLDRIAFLLHGLVMAIMAGKQA